MDTIENQLVPLLNRIIEYRQDDLRTYQDTYSKVYSLLHSNRDKTKEAGDKIYQCVVESIDRYSKSLLGDLSRSENIYESYMKLWNDYYACMLRVRISFMYHERLYVLKQKLPSLFEVGLSKWDTNMMCYRDRILNIAVDLLDKHRKGNMIDMELLASTFSCFDTLSIDYLAILTKSVKEHYMQFIGKSLISDLRQKSIVDVVYDLILSEEERVGSLKDKSLILEVVDDILITKNIEIYRTIFKSLLIDGSNDIKETDIKKIYFLISRVNDLIDRLSSCIEEFILESDTSNIKSFVSMHIYLKRVIKCCNNDKCLTISLVRTLRKVLNNKIPISSTIIYIDDMLRKNGKCKMTEEESLEMIEQTIETCQYYDSKDEFILEYSNRLSYRLIHNESNNLENLSFQVLKRVFGLEYTMKIKSMFVDISDSQQISEEFNDEIFHPIVLTKSIWDISDNRERPLLTDSIRNQQDRFTYFYNRKHANRKITWNYEESRTIVKYLQYQLICTFYQYILLEQFNRKSVIGRDELKKMTGIESEDIANSLIKVKVLCLSKDGTKYALNPKLKYDINKINCIALVSKPQSKEKSDLELERSRQIQMSACLVRNMKKNKIMTHQALKMEVMSQMQSKFNPTQTQFKQAIDYCIEKEIVEIESRTSNAVSYKYLS